MKQLILILSILSLLLFGAWGCTEKTEQSKKESVGAAETVAEKPTDTVETVQAGTVKSAEVATEKAKRVIEELKETPQGSTEETKASE
jgi:polyhydroxyalkanoate synthesis regulator phasin